MTASESPPVTGKGVLIKPARVGGMLVASWAYAGVVILVLLILRWVGDHWWGVTPLLLMPRWLFLVPVALLAAICGLRRNSSYWVLHGAIALAVLGPLMGLNLPLNQLFRVPTPTPQRLRVAAFNLGVTTRPADLRNWLASERVDVVCLQEGEPSGSATETLLGKGWNVSRKGTVASRWPVVSEWPQYDHPLGGPDLWPGKLERLRLKTPSGAEIMVASVHLPTVRNGLTALAAGSVSTMKAHVGWWTSELQRMLSALAEGTDVPMVVAGDFNMPDDDSTLAALRANFRFAFREAGWGYGYTRPSRIPWVRIDHILSGPNWEVESCHVGPNLGSDHLPVVAELSLIPPPATPPAQSPE